MSLLEIKHLKIHFPIKSGVLGQTTRYIKAVDDISFTISKGQSFGLVGSSGAGKSTVAKAILGKFTPKEAIFFAGKDVCDILKNDPSFYRQQVQMIFQSTFSSLNPRKKVLDIISEPIKNFEKLSKKDIRFRVEELLDIVGLPKESIKKYPQEFSGGQRQRIGIARAIALRPKLIVADEPVSALDVSIRGQILNHLKDIGREMELAYLFISHDMSVIKHMCTHIAIMHNGRLVEVGTKEDIFERATHIYTKKLIAAIPVIDPSERAASFENRQKIEREYLAQYGRYYDDNGNVYDLKRISDTHFVAAV